VHKTLKKLVFDRRGGFCWEINFGFQWLLRSLGYSVRVANANVLTPGGPIPGHLCLFVDGLAPDPLLLDPGFGDAPRTPIPGKIGGTATDAQLGDTYTLVKNEGEFGQAAEHTKRFDCILMRSRATGISSSPMVDFIGMDTPPPAAEMTPPEPVYLCNTTDHLPLDSPEFAAGLASVLVEHEMNPFSQKRMCIMVNKKGFAFVGKDYVKTVEGGKETSRKALTSEEAYRAAPFPARSPGRAPWLRR